MCTTWFSDKYTCLILQMRDRRAAEWRAWLVSIAE